MMVTKEKMLVHENFEEAGVAYLSHSKRSVKFQPLPKEGVLRCKDGRIHNSYQVNKPKAFYASVRALKDLMDRKLTRVTLWRMRKKSSEIVKKNGDGSNG